MRRTVLLFKNEFSNLLQRHVVALNAIDWKKGFSAKGACLVAVEQPFLDAVVVVENVIAHRIGEPGYNFSGLKGIKANGTLFGKILVVLTVTQATALNVRPFLFCQHSQTENDLACSAAHVLADPVMRFYFRTSESI
jgi:hypothetical protein